MAGAIGQFIGAILGMALFGAVLALPLRKFLGWSTRLSYFAALIAFLPIAALFYKVNQINPGATFLGGLAFYGSASVLAFLVLVSTAKQTGEYAAAENGPINFRPVFKFCGWLLFIGLAALGATSIFSAIRATYSPEIPFLFGATLLICAFLLWRLLNRPAACRPPRLTRNLYRERNGNFGKRGIGIYP